MIVNVRMLAFQPTEVLRPVKVPDHTISQSSNMLELAFLYGQNDFCNEREITSTTCSVSMGDVIELPDDGNYLILAAGFHKLTDEEYADYRAMSQRDRIIKVIAFTREK